MENIYLMGSENVARAATTMANAATEINKAVGNFEQSLFEQRRFMDEWLTRFEQILEAVKGKP